MKKISRRSFMIASGKAMGAMTVAAAFAGCASLNRPKTASSPLECPSRRMRD